MFGTILSVVIGLAFVYLLLSLIATWVQELLSTALKWRSRELVDAIRNLLDPPQEKLPGVEALEKKWDDGAGLVEKLKTDIVKVLYGSPVIKVLSKPKRMPSYIPSREFSTALFDTLTKVGTEASPALKGLEAFKRGVAELPNPQTREALESFVSKVEEKQVGLEERAAGLRDRMAQWFDATMDRAGGWYKRKAQVVSLAIGIVLAVACNANTFNLVQSFWSDEPLRRAVNEAASEYVADRSEVPPGDTYDRLVAMQLPIGWTERNIPRSGGWFLHVLGWIMTGFAVSQGAPIWFDLLGRLCNIRGSGKRPAVESGQTSRGNDLKSGISP